ncbi:MAG: LPD11 domain-containing protein [Desulfuromonadaceae bacterium]|nr:LPD11 domain-containing protein [Desulfuromonadaceae bacterium]
MGKMNKNLEDKIKADEFGYKMLGRLQMDCQYFIGNGSGHEKHLWALSAPDQIAEMKKLWNGIRVKPEWLSMEDIEDFKSKMFTLKLENEKDNPDFITKDNIADYYEFMGEEELEKLNWGLFWDKEINNGLFLNRYRELGDKLEIPFAELAQFANIKHRDFKLPKFPEPGYDDTSKKNYSFDTPIGLEVFGKKDTLGPMEEYVAKIKESDWYKKYASSIVEKKDLVGDYILDKDVPEVDETAELKG